MNRQDYISSPMINVDRTSVAGGAENVYAGRASEAREISFDDIVFENRNQEYGAYVLRKGYLRNVGIGLVITTLIVVLIVLSPAILRFFMPEDPVVKTVPRKLVYSELSAPPSIDKPKPPPPQVKLPQLRKVIKFVPPKVVRETVVEEVPTIEQIKENEVAAVAVEGETDIIFDEPAPEIIEESNEIFTVVEQQPEFAGGYEAMMHFIQRNMVYPPAARRMGIDGTVHASFVVSKTGEISDIQILRGISSECDKEAIRVIALMPKWIPGRQNGHPVNVRFIMPLKFRLN